MKGTVTAIHPKLFGRDAELDSIQALIEKAAGGSGCGLMVWGDAGVGKTQLVRDAALRADALLLDGSALPMSSLSAPFLALQSAFRDFQSGSHGEVLPFDFGRSLANVPVEFDAWLEGICRRRLVILVIDDLQWADQSSLDVLLYIIAGLTARRLLIIGTLRTGEVTDGHRLKHWLAHVSRMPGISEIFLSALDRFATTEQISEILGEPAHQSLIEDVFAASRGNAYLNRLLVAGLDAKARHLHTLVPSNLRLAVLQAWQRLSPDAREATRVVAIAGGPIRAAELGEIFDQAPLGPLLREAVDGGVLDACSDGTYWFHHPLIAEVLKNDMAVDARQQWHAAFAERLQFKLAATTTPGPAEIVAVADHLSVAGRDSDAYSWALRASDAASASGGAAESLRLLRRALALESRIGGMVHRRVELLDRLRITAYRTGEWEDELGSIEQLLRELDPDTEPGRIAELLVRRADLRFSTGRSFYQVEDLAAAVRLADSEPASAGYALALAGLARAQLWTVGTDATAVAARAVEFARATGDARAISHALAAKAMAAVTDHSDADALILGAEAFNAAIRCEDWWLAGQAAIWEGNAHGGWSIIAYVEHLRQRREQLTILGAPHPYIARLSSAEASAWLALGEWRNCLDRLRVALGSNPGPLADAVARLSAARLAAWQGRQSEAESHLARADELFPDGSTYLAMQFDAVRAEVALAGAHPEMAYRAALRGADREYAPVMCEWLLPLAARALADQVQQASDGGHDQRDIVIKLDALVERFPTIIRDIGEVGGQLGLQVEALSAIYFAEVGRARKVLDNASQWIDAARAAHLGGLAWEELYSQWRAAECLLSGRKQNRSAAAAMIRAAIELADRLQARPIRQSLEQLAGTARITTQRLSERHHQQSGSLPSMTQREREILHHIVAGRTYAEIARSLVISEKTVSSHISNMLRKTGTANRVELARLATRQDSRPN